MRAIDEDETFPLLDQDAVTVFFRADIEEVQFHGVMRQWTGVRQFERARANWKQPSSRASGQTTGSPVVDARTARVTGFDPKFTDGALRCVAATVPAQFPNDRCKLCALSTSFPWRRAESSPNPVAPHLAMHVLFRSHCFELTATASLRIRGVLVWAAVTLTTVIAAEAQPSLTISTPMPAPEWAKLERQLLDEQVPACREFYQKYFDARGYLQCFVRWGANDGPDDAFENFNGWPELHALGGDDEILRLFLKGHEGLIKQYTEARTSDVPIARQGMYYKEFIVQSDWMHHGEGLQLFNRMGLSIGAEPLYATRARRFAGFYMGEDPEAPNYDVKLKLIRSMQNGSRGPMLRKATALDWVGDPFDASGFVALHGESTYAQFLEHYREYSDVEGDHFLNLVATTLPTNAFLVANDPKYKQWLVDYMDAWLDRMRRNGGVIPSYVDYRDGKVGGAENKWWGSAYGWGFSPVNPVNGRRENRNRIPRAMVGFTNAVLVTGDQKYADAWRRMMDAVNSHARTVDGKKQFPTMHGADGWYGWQDGPWNVGATELWYLSMRADDAARIERNPWIAYLQRKDPEFPVTALRRDLANVARRTAAFHADRTPPEKRLADNMLDFNPASISALTQLMQGALVPSREGGLLQARLRYFDPERQRAGVPPDVAALVSELTDTRTVVTLVNTSATAARNVIVQGGAFGEHRFVSVARDGRTLPLNARTFAVRLEPGAGAQLTLTMKRYAETPTITRPWERK
jgi:hypothetical protein